VQYLFDLCRRQWKGVDQGIRLTAWKGRQRQAAQAVARSRDGQTDRAAHESAAHAAERTYPLTRKRCVCRTNEQGAVTVDENRRNRFHNRSYKMFLTTCARAWRGGWGCNAFQTHKEVEMENALMVSTSLIAINAQWLLFLCCSCAA
jgi:hypothetical protein